MKNRLLMLLFVLALSAAVAVAQSSSTPSSPSSTPSQSSDQMGSTSNTQSQSSTTMQEDTSTGKHKDHKNKGDMSAQSANTDDESLHRQVHEQLASNPDLQNVQITVKDGTVTLEGTVPKKDDKHEAKKLAKSVPGVKNVKEHLTVSAAASASTSGMTGSASATAGNPGSAAGEASQSGIASNAGAASPAPSSAGVAGEAGTSQQQSSASSTTSTSTPPEGQNPSSAASSANPSSSSIGNAQQNAGAAASSTQSSASSSVATPSSTNPDVSSAQQQQQSTGTAASNATAPGTTGANQPSTAAGQPAAAGGISTNQNPSNNAQSGVTAESQTQATTAGQNDTDQIRSQIENALKNEPTLSSSNVMVNVTDTKIELSGDVASGKDKQTAKRIAQSYAGNRKVVDKITVKGMGKGANDSNNAKPDASTTPPPQL